MIALMTRLVRPNGGKLFGAMAALAAGAFVACLLLSGDAAGQTDPPAIGDWYVADTTVVRDVHVLLEGNLTVRSTGDLTLMNVTLELNVTRPGDRFIIVDTGGVLRVQDGDGDPDTTGDRTVIRSSRPALEYRWLCEEGSSLLVDCSVISDCGAGWGLIIETDDAVIEHTIISSGHIGVNVQGGLARLADCRILGHDGLGVLVVNGSVRMDRCTVSDNLDIGVLLTGEGNGSWLRNCTVSNHTFAAIDVQRGSVLVEDCSLVNSSWTGIRFNNGTEGSVLRCDISDTSAYGVQVNADCNVTIAGCSIADVGDHGLRVWNASCRVLDNHVTGCSNDGMYIFDSAVTIRGNTVEGVGQTGILLSDCSLFTVYGNVLRDNGISGVVMGSLGVRDCVGWLGDNHVSGNSRTGIYVASNSTCIMHDGVFEDNGWYGIFCQENGTIEWTVSGTSRAVNETLRLRGGVEVTRTGQLTFSNTTLLFDHHPEYGWGEVLVNAGSMWMGNGSEVYTGSDPLIEARDVELRVVDDGSLNATDSRLSSTLVRVLEGRFEAHRCELTGSNRSVLASGPETRLVLEGCTVTDVISGVRAEGASVLVDRCEFLRMEEGIRLVDCTGPGPTVRDTGMFSVGSGVVLEGSSRVDLVNCTFTICRDAVVASDVDQLLVVNCTISKGTGHGIRALGCSVRVTGSTLSECTSGAIVQDGSYLMVEGTSISNNQRVGIMANLTELKLVNASVTGTYGIGVWNSYYPEGQGHDDFLMRGAFLQGSAAYDLRLEGAFLARVYNTNLDPEAVRIFDEVVMEVYNPWVLHVVVEGADPVPPDGTWYELIDQYGRVQGVGELPPGTNLLSREGKAYTMTADNRTLHTPYTVTVRVAGRDWTGDLVLGYGVVSVVRVDLELVPVVLAPGELVEGLEVELDATSSVAYPFNLSGWSWAIDGLDTGPFNGSRVTVTFPADGDYRVHLTVTDTAGNTKTAVTRITVEDAPPEAHIITELPVWVDEDQVLVLEGRYVTVVDDILVLEWDFGDGTKASGPSVDHSWSRAGEYNLTFTVVEADGGFTEDTRSVTVVNVAPEAIIRDVAMEVGRGERFDLDGSSSRDTPSDNGTLSYMWDMGGEPFLTGAQAFWRFEEPGTYTINLMVVDDDGAWDRASMTVNVVNRPPVIGPVPDALLNATDPLWSHGLEVSDPDDDLWNLSLSFPEFEPGGAFDAWVERDDDGGWTVHVRPKEERDGRRADVQVTVRDPHGGEASTTFRIDIDTSMVDEGLSTWWLAAAVLLVLVVLTLGFFHLARRQVPPPPGEGPVD